MKFTKLKIALWGCLSFIFFIPFYTLAQKKDSLENLQQPISKNVIKFDPTPMLLWSMKNVTFSYERILGPKQSMAFTLGYLEFPQLFKDTIGGLVKITSRQKYGINVAFEYRFYLSKRNRRPIPDGIYLAPFTSFYWYHFKNDIDVLKTSLDSAGQINGTFYTLNLGVELGYQFVFWKRFTVDLVLIGPAVSYYGGSLDITGAVNFEKLQQIDEDLYNKLTEKYPMIGDFVINKSFQQNGKLDFLSIGFRYLIQFGFHF
jgi:hypothetical protein